MNIFYLCPQEAILLEVLHLISQEGMWLGVRLQEAGLQEVSPLHKSENKRNSEYFMNCLFSLTGVEGSATGGNAIGGSAKGAGGGVHVTVLTGGGQQEVGPPTLHRSDVCFAGSMLGLSIVASNG